MDPKAGLELCVYIFIVVVGLLLTASQVTIAAGDNSCLSGASSGASSAPPTTTAPAYSPTELIATVAHTTSHSASVVPVNAATDLPASDSSNGASRSVVGFGSALALVGAAVAAFAL